jgi:hypothetical protein
VGEQQAASEPVGLVEAIRRLRADLTQARGEGMNEQLRFRLGPVQMEFQVQVTREGSGDMGVRFYVVSVGGKVSGSRAETHTVTLSMIPQIEVDGALTDAVISDAVPARPPQPGQPDG